MKKLTTLLIAVVLGTGAFAVAASPDEYRDSRRHDRMEKKMEMMVEHLNLSEDQQKQVKTLFEKKQEERKARREAMKKDIDAILTREQQEKWQKHREERKGKRCRRGEKGEKGEGYGRGRES